MPLATASGGRRRARRNDQRTRDSCECGEASAARQARHGLTRRSVLRSIGTVMAGDEDRMRGTKPQREQPGLMERIIAAACNRDATELPRCTSMHHPATTHVGFLSFAWRNSIDGCREGPPTPHRDRCACVRRACDSRFSVGCSLCVRAGWAATAPVTECALGNCHATRQAGATTRAIGDGAQRGPADVDPVPLTPNRRAIYWRTFSGF